MGRIPVYFMPGLAASALIFENIKLPTDIFEMIFLEWEIPLDNELLSDYAKRISEKVTHQDPVLIGVSFGGIIVQEMARYINAKKIIVISSVTNNRQLPWRMKVAKYTKAYKLIPMNLLMNADKAPRALFGNLIRQRLDLYQKYLYVKDVKYMKWAIEQVITWDRAESDKNVIHIHGDSDQIFPTRYIKNCILVKGGTHIMILNKFRWLNENLPKIILNQELKTN